MTNTTQPKKTDDHGSDWIWLLCTLIASGIGIWFLSTSRSFSGVSEAILFVYVLAGSFAGPVSVHPSFDGILEWLPQGIGNFIVSIFCGWSAIYLLPALSVPGWATFLCAIVVMFAAPTIGFFHLSMRALRSVHKDHPFRSCIVLVLIGITALFVIAGLSRGPMALREEINAMSAIK